MYEAMETQIKKLVERIGQLDRQILENDEKIQEHQHEVNLRLDIIDTFRESINESRAKIDEMQFKNQKNRDYIENFKNEDIFLNASQNYLQVYEELSNQRDLIENDLKPRIDKIMIKKENFVNKTELDEIKTNFTKLDKNVSRSQEEIQQLTEGLNGVDARIADIEARSPAGRRSLGKNNRLGDPSASSGKMMNLVSTRLRTATAGRIKPENNDTDQK